MVGCVEQGRDGELVLRGQVVNGAVGTGIGPEKGGVPSTITTEAGDAERLARPVPTTEERDSTLTPTLEAKDRSTLDGELGRRVVITGRFTPGGETHPYDRLQVASMQRIAANCTTH